MLKIVLVAALALTSTPVFAQDGAWQVGNDQVHLRDSSINTRTAAGRARLLVRVEAIAARMCDTGTGRHRARCIADTVSRTMKARGGDALALAMLERSAVALAAR